MLGEKYDERADIYSFGMILTEFIRFICPFHMNIVLLKYNLRREDPPPRVAGAAYGYDEKAFLASVPSDCPEELLKVCLDFYFYEYLRGSTFLKY